MAKKASYLFVVLTIIVQLASCGGGGESSPETEPPQPVPNPTWVRTGGPLGGLGYDIRMSPDDPDVMFVTDAFAGVFKSVDGGMTWSPSNDGITTRVGLSGDAIPIFCLTIDPHNSDTVWAGTQGVRGIYKSTDGGGTWTKTDNGVVEEEGITFRGITVSPTTPDIVYAAAEISSFVWNGEEKPGREFDMTKGVVYRTTDGGQNWQAIWRGDNMARYVWIDPVNTDTIYISTGIFDREAANSDTNTNDPGGVGVVKSTDGGQTWQEMNDGIDNLYVGSLYMHPEDPSVLLAGAGNNAYPDGAGVFRTEDGGVTWSKVLPDVIINSVEFAELEPHIAYAGALDAVYRSDDGGVTWVKMTPAAFGWGAQGVMAGFPIDLQVDPREPDRIFANNYGGGNFLSNDAGLNWTSASKGYTGAQVRSIDLYPGNPAALFAAARSGIFATFDGGDNWEGRGADPAMSIEWNAVAIEPSNPLHILVATNAGGNLFESTDGGESWQLREEASVAEGKGVRSIVFAPSDTDTVYAGVGGYFSAGTFSNIMPGGGLMASGDGGLSWSAINDATSQDGNVAAIAVHPTNEDTLIAATTNHGVLKTTSGGGAWTAVNTGLPPNPVALSVAIDPADTDTLYVGLEFAGLYRSEDGGATWGATAAGLNPQASITDIAFYPGEPETIYVSDVSSGVYRSIDGGNTWAAFNSGLRTRAVNDLAITADGRHIYAATEGEGVFRLDLYGVAPASQ